MFLVGNGLMGLVETSSGTPQLPLKAPSFTSYILKHQQKNAILPHWKVPLGHCISSPLKLTGDDLQCLGDIFYGGVGPYIV